ncbi:MAG: hypothetical protein ACRCZD_12650 [Phycicoccus sp.]
MTKRLVFALSALALLVAAGFTVAYIGSKEQRSCTVTEKDRTTRAINGSSSTDARIWTEECGVLSLNDSLLGLSFNTADKYGSLKVGQTYTFTTMGWRVPIFSMFPNIVEVG